MHRRKQACLFLAEAFLDLFVVPLQVILDDLKDTSQIPLDGDQKAHVKLAVFHDVDRFFGKKVFRFSANRVGDRKFGLAGRQCRDIRLVVREQRPEDFVHQRGQREADVIRKCITQLGEIELQDLLPEIVSPRDAVDLRQGSALEVVVRTHFPVGGGLYGEIGKLVVNVDLVDRPEGTHGLGIDEIPEGVVPDLAVGRPSADEFRGAAQDDLIVRSDGYQFIVLAVQRQHLAGQVFLENVAFQLRAEIGLLRIPFRDVVGVLQIVQNDPVEALVRDLVEGLESTLLDGVFTDFLKRLRTYESSLPARNGDDPHAFVVQKRLVFLAENAAHFIPDDRNRVLGIHFEHQHFLPEILFLDAA